MKICNRAAATRGALEASSELSLRPEKRYFAVSRIFLLRRAADVMGLSKWKAVPLSPLAEATRVYRFSCSCQITQ